MIEKNDTGHPYLGYREVLLVMGTRSNVIFTFKLFNFI